MIRRATPDDARACVTILRGWIEETPWMPMIHSRASMEHFWWGRISECPCWLLEEAGSVMGFALRDASFVTALYLAPRARGAGHGKALLAAATHGASPVRLWLFAANERARRFYVREGFREIRRTAGDNEEGLPDILMGRG